MGVDSHRLGAVVRLIDPHQAIRQLKHVVPKRDDDKLGIPRPLLQQQISASQGQISHKGCQGHIISLQKDSHISTCLSIDLINPAL